MTSRERSVCRIFGLTRDTGVRDLHQNVDVLSQGLIYITGFSGSGKSSLLREIAAAIHYQNHEIAPDESKSVLECFEGEVGEVIQWLGHFGLTEGRLLLTPVRHLSVGQRERLRLALLLRSKPKAVILDEFLASLDRITARNIAFQFQKLLRRYQITAYVATAHDDLAEALAPDQLLHLDFEGRLTSQKAETPAIVSDASEVVIEAGTLDDYHALRRFHYMDSADKNELKIRDVVRVQRARFRDLTVGVRVFLKMYPSSFEKIGIFALINREAVRSSRVIVHPAFRGLGLPAKMDWREEFDSSKRIVFSQSAMALFFPFNSKNYENTGHHSQEKTDQHVQLEKFLSEHGLADADQLGDSAVAQNFWNSLSDTNKEILRPLLINILTEYDRRYFEYVCKYMGLKVSQDAMEKMRLFFLRHNDRVSSDQPWRMLHEGLYFPMQGMVRRIFDYK